MVERGTPRLSILQIAESYPPDYGGGAAVYIQDISRCLASRGHAVRVFCTGNRDAEDYEVWTDFDEGVTVSRINLPYFRTRDPEGWSLGVGRWRAHQARVVGTLDALLDGWTPDIVHYNAARPLGEEILLEVSRRGLPIVMMFHEAWAICGRLMLLRSPLAVACSGPSPLRCLECLYSHYDGSHIRAALKLPWRVVKLGLYPAYRLRRRVLARRCLSGGMAYSRFMADRHRPHVAGPVRYIALGINLAHLPGSRPARPRTPLRFGFFAGFQDGKGLVDVLDAAASLKRQALPFELHVWGPGLEAGMSEIQTRNLEDRVVPHGLYRIEQLWAAYHEIDAAIMATRVVEPFGRIVQEAAASGAPAIAPDVGGISEQIRHDVDGLLFRFRDKGDLERQMRRLLVEPGLLPRLIANLWEVPDTRVAAARVEEFYHEILRGGADPPRAGDLLVV